MKRKCFIFLAIVACVMLLYAPIVSATILTVLGDAQSFAVIGNTGVTNPVGSATIVNGDLGVIAPVVTGFPAGKVTNGSIHSDDGDAINAEAAFTRAITALNGLPFDSTGLPITDLTGLTLGVGTANNLAPGIYTFPSTTAALSGTLTLKPGADPNAVFVFLIGTSLTTASNSSVVMDGSLGGGQDAGVFWVLGTSAELGSNSAFEGNILAGTLIALDPGAQIVCGRAFAKTQVTFAGISSVSRDNHVDCLTCGSSPESLGLSGGLEFTGPDTLELKLISGGNGSTPVPEPATMLLLGSGLVGLAGFARRKFKK